MRIAEVRFAPWDKIYHATPEDLELKIGDRVVVKTDFGTDIGKILDFKDIKTKQEDKTEDNKNNGGQNYDELLIGPVLRKASLSDVEKLPSAKEKTKAIEYAKKMKDTRNLPMKFFDVYFSADGSRITFAFIADGRIDFRELVKDLTRNFGKTIRLQQIGIRDEAKIMGDFGHCGKPLCCRGHLQNLISITSDMADLQQCSHRGSERISGVCGRLMCCLAYEQKNYETMKSKLPPINTRVNVSGKRGVVVGHHILKQSVDVEFKGDKSEGRNIVEVDIKK